MAASRGNLSQPCNSISLSLTARYASTWSTWDGVRELVQNWHDGLLSCIENGAEVASSKSPISSKIAFESSLDYDRNIYIYTATSSIVGQEHRVTYELGRIVYCYSNGRLYLVNHNTALTRKILLLGFSKKANNKEVIGQFGEGLKVGALALIRDGRTITMETSKDRWNFGLKMDEMFKEEVLTVFVNDRHEIDEIELEDSLVSLALKDDGTCVTVARLSTDEWEMFVKRFLFLAPPSDSVKSELGTLLLDETHKGQLYVKGVWVSDLSEDGLASGVDFFQLKIDRDRRAVIHKSDIDHQVSSMWVRAIEQRPELINRYYMLLVEADSSDVKHAATYLSSARGLSLVADRFFELHGKDAYPVSNMISVDNLMQIKKELQLKITLCNESLLSILCNSGFIQPIEDVLSKARSVGEQITLIPFTSLTDKEINILRHAEGLLKISQPKFSLGFVDIIDIESTEIKLKYNKRYQVPRHLLDFEFVHKDVYQLCADSTKCMCCETLICQGILALKDSTTPADGLKGGELVQTDHVSASQVQFARLIASLSLQACRQNPPFCKDLHCPTPSNSNSYSDSDHQLCIEREEALMIQNEELHEVISKSDQQHAQDLKKFETQIIQMEKDLMKQEVKFADIQQQLNVDWQKQLNRVENKNVIMEKDIVELKREVSHLQGKLQSTESEAAQMSRVHSRQLRILQDKCHAQRRHLAQRFEQLSLVVSSLNSNDNYQIQDLAKALVDEVREMDQKDVCVVCVVEKPNCVLLPCRHHVTCVGCANRLNTCPYCRTLIADKISTFE